LVVFALASLVIARSIRWRPAREADSRSSPTWAVPVQGSSADLEKALQLEMAGKFGEAAAAYSVVLARDPTAWMALNGRANCLAALKRYDEALADEARVVQLQ